MATQSAAVEDFKIYAPILTLCLASKDSFLLAACGPYLQLYDLKDKSSNSRYDSCLCERKIFEAENIHGIRCYDGTDNRDTEFKTNVIVFGQFSIALLALVEGVFQLNFHLIPEPYDLILDCCLIADSYLLVGQAQNKVKIYSLTGESIKNAPHLVDTIYSSVVCVLFSMSFHISTNKTIEVASGTAFGIIHLWTLGSIRDLNCDKVNSARTQPYLSLAGHTGVICKLKWNSSGALLISCSDDRTVRLWDVSTGAQIFIGWGHICRVWDVIFIDDTGTRIASCGEDLSIRIWDSDTKSCICVMEGHVGRHTWSVVYSRTWNTLFSCGNDSSIKLWNLNTHLYLSPPQYEVSESNSASKRHLGPNGTLVPTPRSVTTRDQDSKVNQIVTMKFSQDGSRIVLISIDGTVNIGEIHHQYTPDSASEILNNVVWLEPIKISSRTEINCTDVLFTSGRAIDRFDMWCSIGHIDGTVSIMHIRNNTILWNTTYSAHRWKAIAMWIFADANFSNKLWIFTGSAGGELKLWSLVDAETVLGFVELEMQNPNLVSTMLNIKRQIACSCIRLLGAGVCGDVLVGGVKGSISYFKSSLFDRDNICEPIFSSIHAHGNVPVSCLVECNNGFLSAGHDGIIHIYYFKNDHFNIYATLQTMNITCPEQIFLSESFIGVETAARSYNHDIFLPGKIYVSGFQSSRYLICEIVQKYQVMNVEAGGWRRLHCNFLQIPMDIDAFPSVSFASLEGTIDRSLYMLSTRSHTINTVDENTKSSSASVLPCQLRMSSNGRVMYCGSFLQGLESYFAAGGEEGVVKVFSISGLSVVQEVSLPSDCAARTMCSAASATEGILVVAGGRLSFAIWKYQVLNSKHDIQMPLQLPLRLCCSNNAPTSVSQDHRILASFCWTSEYETSVFKILLCDSRGIVRFFLLQGERLDATIEFSVSENPLLSCMVVSVVGIEYCAFGDTTGTVYVHKLTCSENRYNHHKGLEYKAHSMGTNALDIKAVNKDSAIESKCSYGPHHFVVCSGGDDQSMCICLFYIETKTVEKFYILNTSTVNGVCGSAVHALAIISPLTWQNLFKIVSVGMDQRLSVWNCNVLMNDLSENCHNVFQYSSMIRSPLNWIFGRACNIADIGDMSLSVEKGKSVNSINSEFESSKLKSDEESVDINCIIVGEGIQLMKLHGLNA